MPETPLYEERLNANSLLVIGVLLWALALGLVPGILLGEWWWLFGLYIPLTLAIILAFYQMKVELFKEKLVVKFGFIYHKAIEVDKIQDCAPFKMERPVRNYGGWGLRRGRDGTTAVTQAFINDAIKLQTVGETFIISSRKAEALCQAIRQARG